MGSVDRKAAARQYRLKPHRPGACGSADAEQYAAQSDVVPPPAPAGSAASAPKSHQPHPCGSRAVFGYALAHTAHVFEGNTMANKNIVSVLLEERSFAPPPEFTQQARLKPADVARILDANFNFGVLGTLEVSCQRDRAEALDG